MYDLHDSEEVKRDAGLASHLFRCYLFINYQYNVAIFISFHAKCYVFNISVNNMNYNKRRYSEFLQLRTLAALAWKLKNIYFLYLCSSCSILLSYYSLCLVPIIPCKFSTFYLNSIISHNFFPFFDL